MRSLFLLFLLMPVFAQADDANFKVIRVINGTSFVLASGDTVRLASIEAPNAPDNGRPSEPLGNEAKQALEALILGGEIRINLNPGGRDRHNRLLGQVYGADGTWIQGEMLRQGFAMVYSFNDDTHETIKKMLAAEREARELKRGIWAHPYYRVITPQETPEFINRFKLVKGKAVSVNEYHGNVYINFYEHWKGNFAVFLPHKYVDAFAAMHLTSLAGRTICVRGWINYHNAPVVDITQPEQIEVE